MDEEDEKLYKIDNADCRLSGYKKRSSVNDQENRRRDLLLNQRRKREDVFNSFRNITELFSDSENESDHDTDNQEDMEWTNNVRKRPRLKDMFMLSEWMVKLPDDFEEKWLFVICPIGKRCLVHCSKGFTSVYGKRGNRLARFQSLLPNGNLRDFTNYRSSNTEVTILDCIWNFHSRTYFILDLLSWKGQMYMDTETSFRTFWIKSKIEEVPKVLDRSDKNPFPFIPLQYYPCNTYTISSILFKNIFSPLDEVKADGILFYHSETHYTPGETPLVLWLKPFMLDELFNLPVSEEFTKIKPPEYVDMHHYIASYNGKIDKSIKRTRNKKSFKNNDKEMNEKMDVFEQ